MTVGISSHRATVHFTGEAPRDDGPLEMLNGELSIFEEPHHQPEALKAAKVPTLFFPYQEADRVVWNQPRSYASISLGLRQQPTVRHDVTYEKHIQAQFDAGPGWVAIRDFHQNKVVFIDTHSGTRQSIDTPFQVLSSTTTRQGLVIQGPRKIALVDTTTNSVRWSSISFKEICWVHSTPLGDVVVLHTKTSRDSTTSYICRLDAETGEPKYNVRCPFLSATFPTGSNEYFKMFFALAYDSNQQEVTFARPSLDRTMAVFTAVNLKTGDCETRGEVKDLQGGIILFHQNGAAILGTSKGPSRLFRVDAQTKRWVETPFETHLTNARALSQTHGIKVGHHKVSFFSRGENGYDDIVNGSFNLQWTDVAMASDNVAYVSTFIDRNSDKTRFRLLAFDATTGDLFWEHDETFQSEPKIVVNQDSSITWAADDHAVILEN